MAEVKLNMCDSDTFVISEDWKKVSIMQTWGFPYMFGGSRATHGVLKGKVFFEVVIKKKLESPKEPISASVPSLCVGWSAKSADIHLGMDNRSYGYLNNGKKCSGAEYSDYGEAFDAGETILCYLNLDADSPHVGFVRQSVDQGPAFELPKSVAKEGLFPHILLKLVEVEVNFGEKPFTYPPPDSSYRFINAAEKDWLVEGLKPLPSLADTTAVIMVGLPGAGKTTWARILAKREREKQFHIVNVETLIQRMSIEGVSIFKRRSSDWHQLIDLAEKSYKALKRSYLRPRCIIFDDDHVGGAQRHQMVQRLSSQFKSVQMAVVVPNEPIYEARLAKRKLDSEREPIYQTQLNKKKAGFSIPEENHDDAKVVFLDLGWAKASAVVKRQNMAVMKIGIQSPFKGLQSFSPRTLNEAEKEQLTEGRLVFKSKEHQMKFEKEMVKTGKPGMKSEPTSASRKRALHEKKDSESPSVAKTAKVAAGRPSATAVESKKKHNGSDGSKAKLQRIVQMNSRSRLNSKRPFSSDDKIGRGMLGGRIHYGGMSGRNSGFGGMSGKNSVTQLMSVRNSGFRGISGVRTGFGGVSGRNTGFLEMSGRVAGGSSSRLGMSNRNFSFQGMSGGNSGIQRMSGGNSGFQRMSGGNSGIQQMSGGNSGFQRMSGGNSGFQRMTGGNSGFHGISDGNSGFQGMSGETSGFQGVSDGNAGFQGMSDGNASFQGMSGGTSGFQGMSGGTSGFQGMSGENSSFLGMSDRHSGFQRMAGGNSGFQRMSDGMSDFRGKSFEKPISGGKSVSRRFPNDKSVPKLMSGGKSGFQDVSGGNFGVQRLSTRLSSFQSGSEGISRLHGVTERNSGFKGVSGSNSNIQDVFGVGSVFQKMSGGDVGYQGMSGGDSGFQRMSGGHSGFQRMSGGNSASQLMSGENSASQLMSGGNSAFQLMSGGDSAFQLMSGADSGFQRMSGFQEMSRKDSGFQGVSGGRFNSMDDLDRSRQLSDMSILSHERFQTAHRPATTDSFGRTTRHVSYAANQRGNSALSMSKSQSSNRYDVVGGLGKTHALSYSGRVGGLGKTHALSYSGRVGGLGKTRALSYSGRLVKGRR